MRFAPLFLGDFCNSQRIAGLNVQHRSREHPPSQVNDDRPVDYGGLQRTRAEIHLVEIRIAGFHKIIGRIPTRGILGENVQHECFALDRQQGALHVLLDLLLLEDGELRSHHVAMNRIRDPNVCHRKKGNDQGCLLRERQVRNSQRANHDIMDRIRTESVVFIDRLIRSPTCVWAAH